MSKFYEFLKTFLLLIIILQFLPPVIKGLKKQYGYLIKKQSYLGVIPIRGIIGANTDFYLNQVKKFLKDPKVDAVILKIDSPGGMPGSAQILFKEILNLKKEFKKPIFTFCENLCASAAYYVVTASDYIIAQPSSLIGSIGTYMGFPNLQEFLEQYKIKYTTIQSGDYKTTGMIFKDLTNKQRAMLQSISDDVYEKFVEDVESQRPKLKKIKSQEWSNGKTFSGRQALKLGLIDELGSKSDLVNAIKKKTPLEEEITWIYPEKPGMLSSLFSRQEEYEYEENALTNSITKGFFKSIFENLCKPFFF